MERPPPSAGWLRGEPRPCAVRAARPQRLPSERALCAEAGGARRRGCGSSQVGLAAAGSGAADGPAGPPPPASGGGGPRPRDSEPAPPGGVLELGFSGRKPLSPPLAIPQVSPAPGRSSQEPFQQPEAGSVTLLAAPAHTSQVKEASPLAPSFSDGGGGWGTARGSLDPQWAGAGGCKERPSLPSLAGGVSSLNLWLCQVAHTLADTGQTLRQVGGGTRQQAGGCRGPKSWIS